VENSQPLCTTLERDFSEYDFAILGGFLTLSHTQVGCALTTSPPTAGGSLLRPLELCQLGHVARAAIPIFACGTGYEDLETLWPPAVLDAVMSASHDASTPTVQAQLSPYDMHYGKVLPSVQYGGYRGDVTRAVVHTLGGPAARGALADPGLLFGEANQIP
jgi:hypothetical protein